MRDRTPPPLTPHPLVGALAVAGAVASLYVTWFLVADRRLVFLYGHLRSTPFDALTLGRHWMTGLVASGLVLLGATAAHLLLTWGLRGGYAPPPWRPLWGWSCALLALPLGALLTRVGTPPMPPLLAAWILVVLCSGLLAALCVSDAVVRAPRWAAWVFVDGLALVPVLILLPAAVEFGARRALPGLVLLAPLVSVGAAAAWLALMTALYRRFRQPFPAAAELLLSGLTTTYLLLPVVHYATSRPGHAPYISASGNFFAASAWLQSATVLVVAGIVWGLRRWRGAGAADTGAPVRRLVLALLLLTLGGALAPAAAGGAERDVWVCSDGRWVRRGEPAYGEPFAGECAAGAAGAAGAAEGRTT